MKIILIYGLGLKSALDQISKIKKDFDPLSIIELEWKNLSPKQSLVEMLTPSLFSEKRLVILEEPDDKLVLDSLPSDPNLTLVVKISKNLSVSSLLLQQAKKNNAQIIQTSEEKEVLVFPFLDSLAERNPSALAQQEKLLLEYGGQYIMTMLFYLLRRPILPSKNTSSFITQKNLKQRQNFPLDKIKNFYREILETDFKVKQGLIDENIAIRSLTYKFLSL